jgi:hypothetical protein
MDLYAIIDQVVALLQQRERLTYRALQYQFNLDEAGLAALKEELIEGQELAVDKDGKMLVWKGDSGAGVATSEAHRSSWVRQHYTGASSRYLYAAAFG